MRGGQRSPIQKFTQPTNTRQHPAHRLFRLQVGPRVGAISVGSLSAKEFTRFTTITTSPFF